MESRQPDGHGRRRWPWVVLAGVVVLAGGVRLAAALAPPPAIGVVGGSLQDCPRRDNCVHSGSEHPRYAIAPLACPGDRLPEVVDVALAQLERTRLVELTDGYAHLRSASPVWGFVDDLELLAHDDEIEVRAAARLGRRDFDVNRERVEQLRHAVADAGICP